MSRLLMATFALMLVLAAGALSSSSAAGTAARACQSPKYPGNGYFTSLNVAHTTCATGKRLELAYYRCRIRSGIRGRCTTGVLGFRCKESRQSIPTEFDARVTCARGAVRVIHTYQQNT